MAGHSTTKYFTNINRMLYLQQNIASCISEMAMAELALVTSLALNTCVVVFTRKVFVHVQALVSLGTTVHHVKLAKLHLALWLNVMGVRTPFTLQQQISKCLHIWQKQCLHIWQKYYILIPVAL